MGITHAWSGKGFSWVSLSAWRFLTRIRNAFPKARQVGACFGQELEPYNNNARAMPAACHLSFTADDMVFTQHGSVLRVHKRKDN